MKPTLKVTSDFTKQFNDTVKRFRNDEVLVGIPEETSPRSDKDEKEEQPVNNATLLAINEFGSPVNNIPPRPVMAIGILNAKKEIAEEFKKAAIKALTQGLKAVDTYYQRAGIIASNSVKKAINDQEGISAPAESTLRARRAKGFKGEKALIVTGQMRNSITYVVRGDE
jgi:hypothetical protein